MYVCLVLCHHLLAAVRLIKTFHTELVLTGTTGNKNDFLLVNCELLLCPWTEKHRDKCFLHRVKEYSIKGSPQVQTIVAMLPCYQEYSMLFSLLDTKEFGRALCFRAWHLFFFFLSSLSQTSLQIELAILKFPYDSWGTPFQQLKQVVDEPSPQLPADRFSPEFVDFTSQWWAHTLRCFLAPA